MPRISVIMPAYNAEKYIREAMDSILSQSFRDFELIVLNDCSKDGTESAILSYGDERIVYIKNEENLGVARTLNKGLEIAKGAYVARMDADDISAIERLAQQAAFLDSHPEVAVVGVGVTVFDETGDVQTRLFSQDPARMRVDMLFACGLAHPGVMLRKSAIRSLGGYDPEYNGLEDYELWDRVMEGWEICALPGVGLRYRLHGSQVTQNLSQKHAAMLRSLKRRQIARLGMDGEGEGFESYLSLCAGKPGETREQVRALAAFLHRAVEANREAGVYCQTALEAVCRGVALAQMGKLPLADALWACKGVALVSAADVAAFRMKQGLKILLGR